MNVYLLQCGSARKHPFPIDVQLGSLQKDVYYNNKTISKTFKISKCYLNVYVYTNTHRETWFFFLFYSLN